LLLGFIENEKKKCCGKPTVQLQNIGKNPTKFYEILPFQRPFFRKEIDSFLFMKEKLIVVLPFDQDLVLASLLVFPVS
jgi:hypothetical protein